MADDSTHVTTPLAYTVTAAPHGCPYYDVDALAASQQGRLNRLKTRVVRADHVYLRHHYEVHAVLVLLLRGLLKERPDAVHKFAAAFVQRPAFQEELTTYLVHHPPRAAPSRTPQDFPSTPEEEETPPPPPPPPGMTDEERDALRRWLAGLLTAETLLRADKREVADKLEAATPDLAEMQQSSRRKASIVCHEEGSPYVIPRRPSKRSFKRSSSLLGVERRKRGDAGASAASATSTTSKRSTATSGQRASSSSASASAASSAATPPPHHDKKKKAKITFQEGNA